MSNIFLKILYFLIYFLFFSIPFINSKIFISDAFLVNGNFEFTKVIYFNLISSLIIIIYFFTKIFQKNILGKNKNIIILNYLSIFWLIIFISTIFSTSFYQSFFGSQEKGHSFLMWNNLVGLSIVFYNTLDKSLFRNINKLLILSTFILALYGIKQYFFSSNFGGHRLISAMGYSNYISPIFMFVLILLGYNIKTGKNYFLSYTFFLVILLALLLTKSFIAIFLYFSYLLYIFLRKKIIYKKNNFLLTYPFLIVFLISFIGTYFPDKISSFISRFYIFETVFSIIISDIKIFFFGVGFDNLLHYFDNFKNINLYIFENIGFTADRSHNLLFDFFVFTGFFGFLSILYIYFYIFKSLKNNTFYNYGLFLCSIFLLFNPGDIVIYLIMVFYIVYSVKENVLSLVSNQESIKSKKYFLNLYYVVDFIYTKINLKIKMYNIIFLVIILIFSFINIYYSTHYYLAETYSYKKDYKKSIEIFSYKPNYYYNIGQYKKGLEIEKIKSEKYYISKINYGYDLETSCNELLENYKSVENYFYCGDLLEKDGQEKKSKEFYKKGILKLPDLWNKNSKYYNNIIIKNFINGNRFFSEKYSNLKKILKSFENN